MVAGLKKICLVAGARPNFMKIAPIIRALQRREDIFAWQLVHTGQHYDHGMSDVFFDELGIPEPNFHMGAGGGSHAEQTARVMIAFERYCLEAQPDVVVVVGDVDSTLACGIVAKKLKIVLAHVEAGLRSGDKEMPEEINRLVTDSISDYLFVTEPSGMENLRREGKGESDLFFVGHVMVDNLFFQIEKLKTINAERFATSDIKRRLGRYGVVTLHRPSNVDNKETLLSIIEGLSEISTRLPLIFPVHPRTMKNMERFGLSLPPAIWLTDPLSYMEFLHLWKDAALILTDSGGIQEESTALGIPCLTLRSNTERPVTVTEGSNTLVGADPVKMVLAFNSVIGASKPMPPKRPALWDGHAAERIVDTLARVL